MRHSPPRVLLRFGLRPSLRNIRDPLTPILLLTLLQGMGNIQSAVSMDYGLPDDGR